MKNIDLLDKAEKALNQIRPYLEADGGNVEITELTEDFVLKVKLLGACGSCPMSLMTLKAGIEQTVKSEVPQILSVEAVNLNTT